jgi:hypothetical protein
MISNVEWVSTYSQGKLSVSKDTKIFGGNLFYVVVGTTNWDIQTLDIVLGQYLQLYSQCFLNSLSSKFRKIQLW